MVPEGKLSSRTRGGLPIPAICVPSASQIHTFPHWPRVQPVCRAQGGTIPDCPLRPDVTRKLGPYFLCPLPTFLERFRTSNKEKRIPGVTPGDPCIAVIENECGCCLSGGKKVGWVLGTTPGCKRLLHADDLVA